MKSRLLLLALSFAALTLPAQETHVKDPSESQELNTEAYIRLLRTDLDTCKEQIVKETMQLDDKQAKIFWPIYKEYTAELDKLGDKELEIIQEYATNFVSMTNEKADELAQRVMALDDQKIALRRKYYGLMKQSLPGILVARFFQVENQIQLLADLKMASNLPIIEATDQK